MPSKYCVVSSGSKSTIASSGFVDTTLYAPETEVLNPTDSHPLYMEDSRFLQPSESSPNESAKRNPPQGVGQFRYQDSAIKAPITLLSHSGITRSGRWTLVRLLCQQEILRSSLNRDTEMPERPFGGGNVVPPEQVYTALVSQAGRGRDGLLAPRPTT